MYGHDILNIEILITTVNCNTLKSLIQVLIDFVEILSALLPK